MHGKDNFDEHRQTAMRSGAIALVTTLGLAWAGPAAAGKIINIDPPGATAAFAYGINDKGAVVGTSIDAGGVHGYIRAPDGTYTTFNRLNHITEALGINREGQVAGYWRADFIDHGYLRLKGGKLRLFEPSGAMRVEPWGINDSGVIGGFYEDDTNYKDHGFVRAADGTITTFDPSGADNTFVWSINAAGATTGWYEDGAGSIHGFMRGADGTIKDFEVSGAETWPTGINDSGTVTGCYDNGTKCSGFVRSADGTTASFDAPNASKTAPEAINARGVITGTADEIHGFVRYPGGKIATFDAPNATHTYAWGINKDGAIVGYYLDANEVVHAFMRTP